MFEALKKKISGWFKSGGDDEEEEEREEKKIVEKEKKVVKKSAIKEKKQGQKNETAEKLKEIIKERDEKFKQAEEIKELKAEVSGAEEEKEIAEEKVEKPEVKEDKEKKKKEEGLGFFARLAKRISHNELTQETFDEEFLEFEMALLENNVALEVVDRIREMLSREFVGKQMEAKEAHKKILGSLKSAIDSVLIEGEDLVEKIKEKAWVFVILFVGINGSGKTTSIAKVANYLKKHKISCVLGAADTFRAASIEQLKHHGEKLGVEVIAQNYGSDPAAVAFDTIAYAKKHGIRVALIDSAGRMYTNTNLLREMEKIVRVAKPDMKLFVGESITGNDATEQAKKFNASIGIDGIILSKADVDERAGTILSVSHVTGKPILFLGVGQEYDDLSVFKKKDVLKHLGLD